MNAWRQALVGAAIAASVIECPDIAHAQAVGQSVPYLHKDDLDGSTFDYNHGAVDCPMVVDIPLGHGIASPVGAGSYGVAFIEAGWTRYGTDSLFPGCQSQYCLYTTYAGATEGQKGSAGGTVYTWATFNPGARPWFNAALDHETGKWWSRWAYYSGWNNMMWAKFDGSAFSEVFSGLESSHYNPTISTHRHNDNAYSQRSFWGTQGWCYEHVRSGGFNDADVSDCSGYEWTQDVN